MYNIDRNKKIKDVEPIEQSGNSDISGDKIFSVIEESLLNPIRLLYDKNIVTIMCSANIKDVSQGIAYIDIEESSLSEENLNYLDIMCKNFPEKFKHIYYDSIDESCDENHTGSRYCKLIMAPITEDTTVGEVNDYFCDMVKGFKIQDIQKGVFNSIEEAKKYLEITYGLNSENISDEDFIEYQGQFFLDDETLRRHIVYKDSLEKKIGEHRDNPVN